MAKDRNLAIVSILVLSMLISAEATNSERSYAVVFDAGSTGTRVHVFCFDHNLQLIPIGNEIELYEAVKPGLSAYGDDPPKAADSIKKLLQDAQNAVPKAEQSTTPVTLGATAGLRLLPGDKSEKILQAVRDLLAGKSSFKFNRTWVTILDGSQEGSFMWIAINYLLQTLGSDYPNTVGVIDQGGGSMQMAYAVSDEQAKNAPKPIKGEDPYIRKVTLKGKTYHIYVHSYLNYGLLASRTEILNITRNMNSPCILKGYDGTYNYSGHTYKATSPHFGPNFYKCYKIVHKALKFNQECKHKKCTFGGVWNGGGGVGQKTLFLASFFYDMAAQVGFINSSSLVARVRPIDFKIAAYKACQIIYKKAGKKYPKIYASSLPYICMDLVYQYSLLVDGFGILPRQEITLVKELKYKSYLIGAAWPLGKAIELASESI